MKVWLDPNKSGPDGDHSWIWCVSCDEVFSLLFSGTINELSFSYNLENGTTVEPLLLYLSTMVDLNKPLCIIVNCHAANPRQYMDAQKYISKINSTERNQCNGF